MRIAIVGAGRVADTHVRVLMALPDVEIVAVVDPRIEAARRLAQVTGSRPCSSMAELVDEVDCDAVDILTPHHLHYPLAMQALTAGLHVFMDKPLASTVEEGEKLCSTADRLDRTLMVCHNLLFHPSLIRARAEIASGVLGEVTRAEAWSSGWLQLAEWDFRRDKAATGGGAWVDGAAHLIYALEACLGPMDRIRAFASTGSSRLGGEDTAVGVAHFASGPTATLAIGYSDCPPTEAVDWPEGWQLGLRLFGTNGRVQVDFLPTAKVWSQSADGAHRALTFDGGSFDAGFAGALRAFVDATRPGMSATSAWDSLHNLRLVLEGAPT